MLRSTALALIVAALIVPTVPASAAPTNPVRTAQVEAQRPARDICIKGVCVKLPKHDGLSHDKVSLGIRGDSFWAYRGTSNYWLDTAKPTRKGLKALTRTALQIATNSCKRKKVTKAPGKFYASVQATKVWCVSFTKGDGEVEMHWMVKESYIFTINSRVFMITGFDFFYTKKRPKLLSKATADFVRSAHRR